MASLRTAAYSRIRWRSASGVLGPAPSSPPVPASHGRYLTRDHSRCAATRVQGQGFVESVSTVTDDVQVEGARVGPLGANQKGVRGDDDIAGRPGSRRSADCRRVSLTNFDFIDLIPLRDRRWSDSSCSRRRISDASSRRRQSPSKIVRILVIGRSWRSAQQSAACAPADRLWMAMHQSTPVRDMTPPKYLSPKQFSNQSGLSIATVRR